MFDWRDERLAPGQPMRRHRRAAHTSLNFLHFAEEGNRFINQVAAATNSSRARAARITRAVLHALRDRLNPDDAVEFGQGLPMAIKGIYFDQYDLSSAPVIIRSAERFLDFVAYKNHAAAYDFGDYESIQEAVEGVFRVLEYRMDPGQVEHVKRMLGHEVRALIDHPQRGYPEANGHRRMSRVL